MDNYQAIQKIVYKILPEFQTSLGECNNLSSLRKLTQQHMEKLVQIVFPESHVSIKGKTTMELSKEQEEALSTFGKGIYKLCLSYGNKSAETIHSVRKSIEQNEEKLRVINSGAFSSNNGVLNLGTQELGIKI